MTTTTMTMPPMPATNCPSWCTDDHELDWQRHVHSICGTWSIPMADGTVRTHQPQPIEEAIASFEPLTHTHLFVRISIQGESLDEPAKAYVAIQQTECGAPGLYVDAVGEMTADQAEQLAEALRTAVQKLGKL